MEATFTLNVPKQDVVDALGTVDGYEFMLVTDTTVVFDCSAKQVGKFAQLFADNNLPFSVNIW